MMNLLKQILFFKFPILIIGTSLIVASYALTAKTPKIPITVSKQQSAINISPAYLNLVVFGHARLLSAILWIVTLIEGDIEHYKGDKNSWMYYRFKTLANLEPKFYLNYFLGGQYLSIIKDDIKGADAIYRMGLSKYPNDFWLSYHAGFNAVFEMNDPERGLEYYDKIINKEKLRKYSPNLVSLINRIRFTHGKISLMDAYRSILEVSQTLEANSHIHKHFQNTLHSIKTQIDLSCLNSQKNLLKCNKENSYGEPYIFKNNKWLSKRAWREFKFTRKKTN